MKYQICPSKKTKRISPPTDRPSSNRGCPDSLTPISFSNSDEGRFDQMMRMHVWTALLLLASSSHAAHQVRNRRRSRSSRLGPCPADEERVLWNFSSLNHIASTQSLSARRIDTGVELHGLRYSGVGAEEIHAMPHARSPCRLHGSQSANFLDTPTPDQSPSFASHTFRPSKLQVDGWRVRSE